MIVKGRFIDFPSLHRVRDFQGYMVVENGLIKKFTRERPNGNIWDFSDYVIMPGFVDTHTHLTQIELMGKWHTDLLDWLEKYVYPEEIRFLDVNYAARKAEKFFNILAKSGTTTVVVYGPSKMESVDIAFQVAKKVGIRAVMGQTLMDENVPDELKTSVDKAKKDVLTLWRRWNDDFSRYALTLRFALSCSPKFMKELSRIARERSMIIQTHISEQKREVEEVRKRFAMDYAQVYDMAGVLYDKTILAHAVHLNDQERDLIARRNAKIAHCPSANFFLHSGVMLIQKFIDQGINVSLGTDIAAGQFTSILPVLRDTYYANPIDPKSAFYMATMGGAISVSMEEKIGSFEIGKYADFVVLNVGDLNPTDSSTQDILSHLMFRGDERNMKATFLAGKRIFERD